LLRHWPRSQALGGVQLGAEPCFVALAQELNQTPDVLAVNFARKHALVQAGVGIFVRMELLIKQYAPDDLENPDGVDPRSYKRRLKSSKKSSFLSHVVVVKIFERNRPEVVDAGKNDTTSTTPCTYSPLGDVVTCELSAGSLT
jgi:hypothetical protein